MTKLRTWIIALKCWDMISNHILHVYPWFNTCVTLLNAQFLHWKVKLTPGIQQGRSNDIKANARTGLADEGRWNWVGSWSWSPRLRRLVCVSSRWIHARRNISVSISFECEHKVPSLYMKDGNGGVEWTKRAKRAGVSTIRYSETHFSAFVCRRKPSLWTIRRQPTTYLIILWSHWLHLSCKWSRITKAVNCGMAEASLITC